MRFRTLHPPYFFNFAALLALFLAHSVAFAAPSAEAPELATESPEEPNSESNSILNRLTQSPGNLSVGGLLGVASGNQGIGSGLGYGFEGSWYFAGPVGVGAFFKGATHSNGISSRFFGGEALVRFDGVLPGLQLGAMLGTGRFAVADFTGLNALAGGPKLAFDFPIASPVTLGLDMSLIFTQPGTELVTLFTPVAAVKLWF